MEDQEEVYNFPDFLCKNESRQLRKWVYLEIEREK